MSDAAIRVEGLGKRFAIGEREFGYRTLREDLMDLLKSPWRRKPRATKTERAPRAEIWALRNVSFEVSPGEVVGVIGRNGAGKSTLLKVLSRITPPTEGRAEIRGRVGSLLEVGTGFHPELTGRENVFLAGAILGMRRAEIHRRFDEIVAFSEVERFIDTPVKRYSSGMYLRLAFAVAAHLDPEILLVDEVLAVGDASFQKKCLGRMRDDALHGRTVLFVSHNLAAVTQLCSRVVYLDVGGVRYLGSPASAIERYLAESDEGLPRRTWDPGSAPGDDRVRLLEASVLQAGDVTGVVDINRPLELEMRFRALRPLRNLVAAANFFDGLGTCLFSVADWRPNTLAPGDYVKRLSLPAQIFAEGRVEVLLQLVFYDPDVRSVVLPSALAFSARDSDDPSSLRGPYKGPWPGVMRIRADWGAHRPIDVTPPAPATGPASS